MVLLAVLIACLIGPPDSASATNPIQAENAHHGSHWPVPATDPPAGAIEGYASSISAAPGGRIALHVSTRPGARYRIAIYRLGWYGGKGGRRRLCLPDPHCKGDKQGKARKVPAPDANGKIDAGWPVTDRFSVPSSWVSGYYVARLILTTGKNAGAVGWVPLIVRPSAKRTSRILVQVPVNTWEAYNNWGGKSLYGYNSTGPHAVKVSFNRPFVRPAALEYEWPLLRFLEARGYDVSYVTDVDVARKPALLRSHRLVIVAGHGEYWSKAIRDGLESARNASTNLAFTGANTGYWQVRYEDSGRTVVEYRHPELDPDPDPSQKTIRFRDLVPPRPECELLGIQYRDGIGASGAKPGAYTITDAGVADPWNVNAGFAPGSSVPGVVGQEWDTFDPGCAGPPRSVLFHWAGQGKSGPSTADVARYTAQSGARVFAAGSLEFSWGLADRSPDPRLQRFMKNALDDLSRPAAPVALAATERASHTQIEIRRHLDPNAAEVDVYRHPGSGAFRPTDRGAKLACRTRASRCTATRVPPGRTERFDAVVVDRWTRRSIDVLSDAVHGAATR